MPIKNEKGLAALRALSQGGTPGLDSYKQAQAQEAASRTSALQNALGGTDVAAAAQKAQATYAPKVTAGAGIDNLDVAANSYLSNASNKLAAQNYEDQQNLALQAEALKRQNNEQHMLAAADAMAAQQRADLGANLSGDQQLANLAERKADLRSQLTQLDQLNNATPAAQVPVYGPTKEMRDLQALLAVNGGDNAQGQEYQRRINELISSGRDKQIVGQQANPAIGSDQGLIGTAQRLSPDTEARRADILAQMAGLDTQFGKASQEYAGRLGTDNKGFLEAYAAADRGDTNAIKALNEYLAPTRETALQQGNARINVGEQARLRALAPAFGIDPLTAAGMFRESEGKELGRVKQAGAEGEYIEGGTSKAEQAAAIKAGAQATGLSESRYSGLRENTGFTDEEIVGAVQSPDWGPISEIANEYVGKDRTKNTGVAGFRKDVEAKLADLVDETGKPVPDDVKKKMLELAVGYYSGQIAGSKSEAETE